MKTCLVAVLCVVLFSVFAVAQPDTRPANADTAGVSKAMTPEEAQQMRDAVKALGGLFGLNTPKQGSQQQAQPQQQGQQQTQPQQQQPPPDQKSMAEVADKALDLTAKGIAYIAQNIEKTAPWVWKVMMRQQYANAIAYLIVPWGFFLMTLVYTIVVRRKVQYNTPGKVDTDDVVDQWRFVFRAIVPTVFMVIFAWWGLNRLSDSIQILINPEYYAIKNLLQIILNPGTL